MMTKSDVVDAFIRGDLDRRGFIKKLTAVGVSSAAAVAYAASLGQGAAAAPSRNGAGFVTRAQDADEEYGPAIPVDQLQAAVAALVTAVQEIADALSSLLDQFDAGDFAGAGLEEAARELLGSILSQIREQLDALNSFLGQPIGMRLATTFMQTTASTPAEGSLVEQLIKVANDLNRSVGMYSALIPSMEEMEGRQLMTQIGLVAGRHAALVSHILGLDPVPGAFEQPIVPDAAE